MGGSRSRRGPSSRSGVYHSSLPTKPIKFRHDFCWEFSLLESSLGLLAQVVDGDLRQA